MSGAPATESTEFTAPQTQDQGGAPGPVVDYSELLSQVENTGKTVETLRADLARERTTNERVRRAFTGEDEKKKTPSQQRIEAYRDFQKSLEEETQGRYPVTEKLGRKLSEIGAESEERFAKQEEEIERLKEELKRSRNPAYQGLERAAFIMEGMVDDALVSLYGSEPNSKGIRSAQFNAVTSRINEEIRDLLKNDPDALLQVQRNPKVMRNMVNHFMAEMLPPKVRERMEEDRIKSEPMDASELYQAFAEARDNMNEAEQNGDEKAAAHYSNMMTEIRRDILGHQYQSRREGKPTSINKLMNSYGR